MHPQLLILANRAAFAQATSDHPEPQRGERAALEYPTIVLAMLIYASWTLLTLHHDDLPLPLLTLFGGILLAWHGSLQHETIHGHPTRNRWINSVLGFLPLALWLPYAVYHRSHLAHHKASHITDPSEDPESHYCAQAGTSYHWLLWLESSLIGRLILGPPIRISRFLVGELVRAWRTPAAWAMDWVPHLAALVPLIWWLHCVNLPIGTYLLAFVYPGTALSLLRSFAEHRADNDPRRRAAIIERPGVFGLLFLNNNLHAVHHARPDLAWYRLPSYFDRSRDLFEAGLIYRSYGEIARRFAWRAQDHNVHPDYRGPTGHAS